MYPNFECNEDAQCCWYEDSTSVCHQGNIAERAVDAKTAEIA